MQMDDGPSGFFGSRPYPCHCPLVRKLSGLILKGKHRKKNVEAQPRSRLDLNVRNTSQEEGVGAREGRVQGITVQNKWDTSGGDAARN